MKDLATRFFAARPRSSASASLSLFASGRSSERAIMHHLFDACAGSGDLRGEIGQTPGTIADHRAETTEAAICHQTTLDYTTKHIRIDVAAAEQKDHAPARQTAEFSRQTGSERS